MDNWKLMLRATTRFDDLRRGSVVNILLDSKLKGVRRKKQWLFQSAGAGRLFFLYSNDIYDNMGEDSCTFTGLPARRRHGFNRHAKGYCHHHVINKYWRVLYTVSIAMGYLVPYRGLTLLQAFLFSCFWTQFILWPTTGHQSPII